MIRDLTKSALSLSWALSLLGAEQAINVFRPGQQNPNKLAPMAEAAASQLDQSMKGFYRTGDHVQGRLVDMAFSWLNPATWLNPGNWGNIGNAGTQGGRFNDLVRIINPLNWTTLARNTGGDDYGYVQDSQSPPQPTTSYSTQSVSSGQSSPQPGNIPVANESPVSAWGPMPGRVS